MATNATTIEELQQEHQKAVESNRALGVIDWQSNDPQATDVVYEVEQGYHRVPVKPGSKERKALGPGHRFHPTKRQVRTGSLRGKARELTQTEYSGIRRSQDPARKARVQGADIGLRNSERYPMAPSTLKYALENGLRERDFQGIEPEGSDGRYLMDQVEAMVEAAGSGHVA